MVNFNKEHPVWPSSIWIKSISNGGGVTRHCPTGLTWSNNGVEKIRTVVDPCYKQVFSSRDPTARVYHLFNREPFDIDTCRSTSIQSIGPSWGGLQE